MTPPEMTDVLTTLSVLDPLHSVSDQTKLAEKVMAWMMILEDCEYETSMLAMRAHYRDPNAKSITPAILRMKTLQATVNRSGGAGVLANPQERSERACRTPGCHCTHSECYDGWLDQEEVVEKRGMKYTQVRRCPTCLDALQMKREL